MTVPLAISESEAISFEPKALGLLSELDRTSKGLLERSVSHARLRSGRTVKPEDVRAAVQDVVAEIATAVGAALSGTLTEVEFSDADFQHLSALPIPRNDAVNPGDDDL